MTQRVTWLLLALVVGMGACSNAAVSPAPSTVPTGVLRDDFLGPDQLITNEYVRWNPKAKDAVVSPTWIVTSGSLFRRANVAWSGALVPGVPDAKSSKATNSAVFRMISRNDSFQNVTVRLRYRILSLIDERANDWDGIHIFLRYQDPTELYYVTIARRDAIAVAKRKTTGGLSNGGTYETLASAPGAAVIRPGVWVSAEASIRRQGDDVRIELLLSGVSVLTVIDSGQFGSPLFGAGSVGVRGDNVEFELDDVKADELLL